MWLLYHRAKKNLWQLPGSVGGSDRAKHIDLRLHFVHDAVKDKIVSLHSVKSEHNVADIQTKALPEPAFAVLHKQLMGL